jgi:hypothetical protein
VDLEDQARPNDSFSFPRLERFRRHSPALSEVIGFTDIDDRRVILIGQAGYARGEVVSGNNYAILGVTMVLGRPLTEDDDSDGAAPSCVISYRHWESRFGRDPSVVGKKIILGSVPFTLVGVEPKGSFGLIPRYEPAFRIPMHLLVQVSAQLLTNSVFLDSERNWVRIAARVPRTNEAQAAAGFNVVFQQFSPPEQHSAIWQEATAFSGMSAKC